MATAAKAGKSKVRYIGRGHEFRSGVNHLTGQRCHNCGTRIRHRFVEGCGVVTEVLRDGEWIEVDTRNPVPSCAKKKT
jgi:hypothetical protein